MCASHNIQGTLSIKALVKAVVTIQTAPIKSSKFYLEHLETLFSHQHLSLHMDTCVQCQLDSDMHNIEIIMTVIQYKQCFTVSITHHPTMPQTIHASPTSNEQL